LAFADARRSAPSVSPGGDGVRRSFSAPRLLVLCGLRISPVASSAAFFPFGVMWSASSGRDGDGFDGRHAHGGLELDAEGL